MTDRPDVAKALNDFMAHTTKSYPELHAPYDPEWRSPCEIGEPTDGDDGPVIAWRPLPRHPDTNAGDFAPLERAVETEIHPDIKAYYGAFWAAGLEAEAIDGHVSLLFLWNGEDIERLNENLIGHAFAKQQARAPLTVFFACTEPDSELFLAVDNASGAVVLEKPGYKPIRQVADNLAGFIETLVPRPPILHR
ncbi:MAG: SecY-interacting protein Syd [Pseudomonadota bacterium]